MDRDQFIRVLMTCIESATGRVYPDIEWERLSDRALVECAEMIRDLLEKRTRTTEREAAFPERMH